MERGELGFDATLLEVDGIRRRGADAGASCEGGQGLEGMGLLDAGAIGETADGGVLRSLQGEVAELDAGETPAGRRGDELVDVVRGLDGRRTGRVPVRCEARRRKQETKAQDRQRASNLYLPRHVVGHTNYGV